MKTIVNHNKKEILTILKAELNKKYTKTFSIALQELFKKLYKEKTTKNHSNTTLKNILNEILSTTKNKK